MCSFNYRNTLVSFCLWETLTYTYGGQFMKPFSVNLSTIFTEVPFLERFKKAKEAGFKYVECQFPYDVPIRAIEAQLIETGLTLVLINLPPGNWEQGDRGMAIFSDRIPEFKESVQKGIEYARALGVEKIHCLAGVLTSDMNREQARQVYLENLKYAALEMAREQITLLIEPINHADMPWYFLHNIGEAAKVLDELELSNLMLQFDFYHIQRLHGNLLVNFERFLDRIGHIQVADVPGRHEPGTGEINYQNVISEVRRLGYRGYIGLEYTPIGKSEDSFGWVHRFEGVAKT